MSRKFNPFSDPVPDSTTGNTNPAPFNKKLLEHLQQGNSINFMQAKDLGISNLDKHIADLRKRVTVYSRVIRINRAKCFEYSLQPFV